MRDLGEPSGRTSCSVKAGNGRKHFLLRELEQSPGWETKEWLSLAWLLQGVWGSSLVYLTNVSGWGAWCPSSLNALCLVKYSACLCCPLVSVVLLQLVGAVGRGSAFLL